MSKYRDMSTESRSTEIIQRLFRLRDSCHVAIGHDQCKAIIRKVDEVCDQYIGEADPMVEAMLRYIREGHIECRIRRERIDAVQEYKRDNGITD